MICAQCGTEFAPLTPHRCPDRVLNRAKTVISEGWPGPADDPEQEYRRTKRNPYYHVDKYGRSDILD